MNKKNITIEEAIAQTLAEYATELDVVAIPGFGSFSGVKRDERVEQMPDGKKMLMPPSVTITFKPSVLLRNKLG